jgi:hypothetical protein
MLQYRARFLILFAAGSVLCSCGADATRAVEPLLGAHPITVSLQSSTAAPSGELPRFQVVGLAGEIQVVWDVESGPCMLAEARGAQAGSVIEIQILRSGDPLANCAPGSVAYHYVARVQSVTAGPYEVRLIDAPFGLTAQEVGRAAIVVNPAA